MSQPIPGRTGVFARALNRSQYGTPIQAARKARDHGLSWVALMAMGVRGSPVRERSEPIEKSAEYAHAFREADVDVWIWFYPLATAPSAAARIAGQHLRACGGRGLILDVEKPYFGKPVLAAELVRASLDELDESTGIAVTSYPLARVHPRLPWGELVAGTGMPQTYTIAPSAARRAVDEWRARGHTSITPIGPAFGARSGAKLLPYLRSAYLDDGKPIVDGIGLWSWPQMGGLEWRAIEAIAKWW